MNREEMIEEIIERQLEVNYSDRSYVREKLYTGIKGYINMTDEELKQEYDHWFNPE